MANDNQTMKDETGIGTPPPAEGKPSEVFVAALTSHQTALRGFITASLGGPADASEVLQRTNLTLWEKADQFDDDRPFLPWAIAFARYEVLGYRREHQRSRMSFATDVVELMCTTSEQLLDEVPTRLSALEKCLEKVPENRQSLLTMRYGGEFSMDEMSARTGKSVDSIKSILKRLRSSLADCISRQLVIDRR